MHFCSSSYWSVRFAAWTEELVSAPTLPISTQEILVLLFWSAYPTCSPSSIPFLLTFSHIILAPSALQSGPYKQLMLLCISLERRSSLVLQRDAWLSGQQKPGSELGTSCASRERGRFQFSQARRWRLQEGMLIVRFLYLPMKCLQQQQQQRRRPQEQELELPAQYQQNLAEDPKDHWMVWKSCQEKQETH